LRDLRLEVTLVFVLVSAALLARRARPWAALSLVLGVVLAAILAPLPPWVFILPVVAAPLLVVLALHRPSMSPAAFAVAPVALAYFVDFDLARIAPVSASLACFSLWSVSMEDA